MTHDLNVLPALTVGTVAALCVTVLLLRRSILTEKLARRGQHIAREYSVDLFERMRVADVMDDNPPLAPAGMTVRELNNRIAAGDPVLSARQGTLLVDEAERLAGILTRSDLLKALRPGLSPEMTVLEAASTRVEVIHPEATLYDAVALMLKRNIGRLAVVHPTDSRRVVGYLGRADILAARARLHAEEEEREQGPLLRSGSGRPPA